MEEESDKVSWELSISCKLALRRLKKTSQVFPLVACMLHSDVNVLDLTGCSESTHTAPRGVLRRRKWALGKT